MQVHELGQCCVQIVLIYMFKYFVNVLKRYYQRRVVRLHCTVQLYMQLLYVVYIYYPVNLPPKNFTGFGAPARWHTHV